MNVRGLLKEFKKLFSNNFILFEDQKEIYKKGTKSTNKLF